MVAQSQDPVAFVAGQPLGAKQIQIAAVAVLAAAIEGFDIQSLAFVAPLIAAEWGVGTASFGIALAAAVIGGGVGMLTVSPLADRFGRRRVFALTFLGVGLFSLLTLTATSPTVLIICRFFVGFCMGGSLPAIMSLSSEYMPTRLRATIVTIGFCGMPLGAALGGLAMAGPIDALGWRSVFVVGGLAPLLALPLCLALLPESIAYLASRPDGQRRLGAVFSQLKRPPAAGVVWRIPEASNVRSPARAIFGDGRLAGTAIIWSLFAGAVSVMYFFINWTPALLVAGGFEQREAVQATSMLNLGAVIGALVFARWIDIAGPRIPIATGFALAVAALLATAMFGLSPIPLFAGLSAVGLFLSGGQFGLNVLCVSFYPPTASATGLGWALAAGRIGAVASSALGGLLIGADRPVGDVLLLAAAPTFLCFVLMLAFGGARQAARG